MVYADKSEYYGEWVKGKKQGEGMYIYKNKDEIALLNFIAGDAPKTDRKISVDIL